MPSGKSGDWEAVFDIAVDRIELQRRVSVEIPHQAEGRIAFDTALDVMIA